MKKISRSEKNLNLIIENMNDVLSKSPQVVEDVYISNDNVNVYLKKRLAGRFGSKTVYDFAILNKDEPIINILSFSNQGSDGYTITVSDVNTKEVLYEMSIYQGDKYHEAVFDIYDKLESLYMQDVEDNAMNAILNIFNIK